MIVDILECLHIVFLFWLTGWEIGPERVDVADTLICNARYNQSIFNKHRPPDVNWFVPGCDPVSCIMSAVMYYLAALVYLTFEGSYGSGGGMALALSFFQSLRG